MGDHIRGKRLKNDKTSGGIDGLTTAIGVSLRSYGG
jgi:hypothetical protein